MKQEEYGRLAQEIRDVLLYNQDKAKELAEEIAKLLSPDYDACIMEADNVISEQLAFLKERGIEMDMTDLPECQDIPFAAEPFHELSWEEVVGKVREEGYKDVKIEDILTPEEIEHAERDFKEITDTFAAKTKLTKGDIAFLSIAVLLQVIRQYFITTLSKHEEKKTAAEAEEGFKKKYDKEGTLGNRYYRASMDTILHYKTVPYDIIAGSKDANIAGENKGINGLNHRYYTLGHDPSLYVIFGTSNILTNTSTFFDGRTFHIKYRTEKGVKRPKIVEEADTLKMFRYTLDRLKESANIQTEFVRKLKSKKLPDKEEVKKLLDSFAPTAAFVKARYHLKSDASKNGLPMSFLQLFSPEFTKELAEYGFDAAGFEQFLGDVGKQAFGSMLINSLIAILHGAICKAEYQEDLKFVQVRTRKILLISNLIATTSNVVINGVTAVISAYTENKEGLEFAYKHMDVGGALVTLTRVFSDLRFIGNMWDEFVMNKMNEKMLKIMADIENIEKSL